MLTYITMLMAETFPSLSPASVLCVVAHADDIEAFMGGTVARWASEGAKVHYLVLTDGHRGTPAVTDGEGADVRNAEQRKAAEILGASTVTFAGFPDCELALTAEVKREIVRAIRTHKPEVVMSIDPSMVYSAKWGIINHIDHRIAGEAVLTAVYPLACNEASFPELRAEGLATHKVATVLLVHSDIQNFYIDISDHMERKLSAMRAHTSQQKALEPVFAIVQSSAEQMGAHVGARYAEGFVRIDIRI